MPHPFTNIDPERFALMEAQAKLNSPYASPYGPNNLRGLSQKPDRDTYMPVENIQPGVMEMLRRLLSGDHMTTDLENRQLQANQLNEQNRRFPGFPQH